MQFSFQQEDPDCMNPSRFSTALLVPAVLISLAACGGGGGGGATPPSGPGGPPPVSSASPSPSPSPTPIATSTPGTSSSVVTAEEAWVNGDMSWYTSGTASWSNHAGGTSSAPSGASVDGMSCSAVTEGSSYPATALSQHAYVGIYNNGVWEALPQAIGMVKPQPPTTPYPGNPQGHQNNTDAVEVNQCEYNVHTHDYSGLIHIEDQSLPQSNTALPAYATLQTLFDLWGAQLGATGITAGSSSLTGAVTIYAGTPTTKDSSGNDLVTTYAAFTGSAASLQFAKHMAVWIVVGTPPASGLPQVRFVVEN